MLEAVSCVRHLVVNENTIKIPVGVILGKRVIRAMHVEIHLTSYFPIIHLFQHHTMFCKCVKHYVAKDSLLLFALKDISSHFPLSIRNQ